MMEIGRLATCPKGDGEIIGLLLGYAVVRLESGEEWVGLQKEVKCKRLPARHEVVCGNIGFVYAGTNEDNAKQVYDQYVALSLSGVGRAGRADVCWLVDGEVRIEHTATNALNVRSEEGPAENLGVCHTLMGDGSTVTQVGDLNKLPDVWSGAPADAPDPFEPM